MKTYKQKWLDLIGRDLSAYDRILAMNVEVNFDSVGAEITSDPWDDLLYVITLETCPSIVDDRPQIFLRRALNYAEKIEAVERYNRRAHVKTDPPGYQETITRFGRAEIAQALAVGRSILNKCDIDRDLMEEAIAGFEFYTLDPRIPRWHMTDQWEYHKAVFMALAIGDIDRAVAMMAIKKSFAATKMMHDAMKKTIKAIAKAPNHQLDPQSDEGLAFQDFFDDMRNPAMNEITDKYGDSIGGIMNAAFHLALVKERFVTGNLGAPNWRRVFDSIAE